MTKQQAIGTERGKSAVWRYAVFALALAGALGIARAARTQPRPLAGAGQPLTEPLALHSQNGVLDVSLYMEVGQAQFAGMTFDNAWTYHVGQDGPPNYPGPTLYVNPGDTLRVHYVNQLTQSTNLHTHGLHVSPLGNSDNVLLIIPPNASNDYEIKIPKDHPQGLYWYHPHFHGFVDAQIYQGLSGFLVIGRPDGGFPQLNGARQRLLELRYDYAINGAINPNIPFNVGNNGATFTDLPHMLFTVNGQLNPTLDIQPGETQVWNVGNVSNNGYFFIHLRGTNGAPDQPLVLVAQDGDPFTKPVTLSPTQRLLLPPGQRYSMIVQGPPAGTYELAMEQYSDGFFLWPNSTGMYAVGQPLATMVSAGTPLPPKPIPQKLTPPANQFEPLGIQPVNFRRNAVFSIGTDAQGNAIFLINGQQFPNNPVFQPRLNTVEEWTLLNQSIGFSFGGVQHPFHIHVNDFQLQSVFDPMNPENSFFKPRTWYQDIINLPGGAVDASGNLTFPGQVVLRMKPLDFLGTYVYHCHRVDHEDAGMMALITIIPQVPTYATGAGPGAQGPVRVFNGNNNKQSAVLHPFPSSAGTRVAVGDVNNDGIMDVAAVPGPGSPPRVRVFSGKGWYKQELLNFLAFDKSMLGGLNIALGDLNSDGYDDIIVAPASGAPPEVRIYSGKDGSFLGSFMAYESTFTGGVTLAAGILQDGGRVSIITGPGPGRAPEVRVFDVDWYGQHSLATAAAVRCSCKKGLCACGESKCACPVGRCGCSPKPVGNVALAAPAPLKPIFQTVSQLAYDATFMGGVNVGAGPIDGQNGGFSVVITGPASGAPPLVQTFILNNPAMAMAHAGVVGPRAGNTGASLTLCSAVMAYAPSQMQGVTVSAVSTPTGADLVVGPSPGANLPAQRFKFDPVAKYFTLVNQSSPYGPFHGGFTIAGK